MDSIELLLLFSSSRSSENLTVEARLIQLKSWLINEEWLTVSELSHPTVMKMLSMWETWYRTPCNDNKLYEEFKASFLLKWESKWWDYMLFNTWFMHPIYYLNQKNITTYERDAD